MSNARQHRFRQRGKSKFDPAAIAAAAMAAASGAPQLPLFALPEGIPLGALGWGMVPPVLPPIPAIPAHLKARMPGQYLAGGWEPSITPGIAKRLKAAAVKDIKGQQQKELDASGPSSLASVLGDEETNAKNADAFAKSGGVAPHGVLADWAAGREHAGGGGEDRPSNGNDSVDGSGRDKKVQRDGSQGSDTAGKNPNDSQGRGTDHGGGGRVAGTGVDSNENGDGAKAGEGGAAGGGGLGDADSSNDGKHGAGVGSGNTKGGVAGTDVNKAGTAQDDRIPSSDFAGIIVASNIDVSNNMVKDRIEQLGDDSAYAEGLPKLGDVPDDPYPPLNDIPPDRGGAVKSHDYGNRTDGKWTYEQKTGYWVKVAAASPGAVDIQRQQGSGVAHESGPTPVSSATARKTCRVPISACSKPPSTLSDVEARVCTGRLRNGTAPIVGGDTNAPKMLTREKILSGCLLFLL